MNKHRNWFFRISVCCICT